LKKKRGCEQEGDMAFRFTSPLLAQDESKMILKECPIGRIKRDGSHVYDAISAFSYAENGCFNPLDMSMWFQQASRVIGSEKSRLFEMKQKDERVRSDARYTKNALQGRG
jgi:hypothetical protein